MLCPIYRQFGVELTRYLPNDEAVYALTEKKLRRELNALATMPNMRIFAEEINREECSDNVATAVQTAYEEAKRVPSHRRRSVIREILHLGKNFDRAIHDAFYLDLLAAAYEVNMPVRIKDIDAHFKAEMDQRPDLFRKCLTDPHCYEVSSSPMESWRKLKQFYRRADHALESFGCLRHSEILTGSAGHVHVEMTVSEAYRVARVLLDHPWVMMAFDDPRNDQAPLINPERDRMDESAFSFAIAQRIRRGKSINMRNLRSRAPVAWRATYGTLEYRLFDVAQTWGMQEEHVAFAQAFTEWALCQPDKRRPMCMEEVLALRVEDCQAGFERLIRALKLPWERYCWYADNNIPTRFELGTPNFKPLETHRAISDASAVSFSDDGRHVENLVDVNVSVNPLASTAVPRLQGFCNLVFFA